MKTFSKVYIRQREAVEKYLDDLKKRKEAISAEFRKSVALFTEAMLKPEHRSSFSIELEGQLLKEPKDISQKELFRETIFRLLKKAIKPEYNSNLFASLDQHLLRNIQDSFKKQLLQKTVIQLLEELLKPTYSSSFIGDLDKKLLFELQSIGQKDHYRKTLEDILAFLFGDKQYLSNDRKYNVYLKRYFENLKIDPANAALEFRAYIEYRFGGDYDDFFHVFLPNHNITVMTAIWSFLKKGPLPAWRYQSRNIDDQTLQKRTDALNELIKINQNYSTVWEVLANNIDKAFYFFQSTPGDGKMSIYTFEMVRREVHEVFTEIDASHRITGDEKNYFLGSLDTYREKRNAEDGGKERKYQYQVMRWYIRSGLCNPEKASWRKKDKSFIMINLLENNDGSKPDNYEELTKIAALYDENDSRTGQYKSLFEVTEDYTEFDNAELDKVIKHIEKEFPEHIDCRLALFDSGFLRLVEGDDNDIRHIYWIPMLTNWGDRRTGGVFYINSNKRIEEALMGKNVNQSARKSFKGNSSFLESEELRNTLNLLTFYLNGLFFDKQIEELEVVAKKEISRAAGVSIITRNISHNIGGHVLKYIKSHYIDENHILKNNVLEGLIIEGEEGKFSVNPEVIQKTDYGYPLELDNLSLDSLKELHVLIEYLQERQDYIGAIASGCDSYFSSVNFKESILENFTHPNKILHNKQVDGTGNLLLNHIAYSEEFKGHQIVFKCPDKITFKDGTFIAFDHLEVALPLGILGRQAIYSIFENIIRNTAKHGQSKNERPDQKIIIEIEILDTHDKDYFKIFLTDNSGNTNNQVIRRIQNALDADLTIGEEGKANEHSQGIKEIQISAAWLRGFEPGHINVHNKEQIEPGVPNDLSKSPIITVERVENKLKYGFLIRKPHDVLIISTNKELSQKQIPNFWKVLTFTKQDKSIFRDEKIDMSYDFILIDENSEIGATELQELELHSAVRTMTYNVVHLLDQYQENEEENNMKALEAELYKHWLKKKFKYDVDNNEETPNKIAIIDDLELNKNPSIARHEEERQLVDFISPAPLKKGAKIGETQVEQIDQPYEIVFWKDFDDHKNLIKIKESFPALFDNATFIESINQENATHRHLRSELIDDLWYAKNIEAAITNVLIIDEGIWHNIRDIDEKDQKELILDQEIFDKKNILIANLSRDEGGVLNVEDIKGSIIGEVLKSGEIEFKEKFSKTFHFVCLHQALLDNLFMHCLAETNYTSSIIKDKKVEIFTEFKQSIPAQLRYIIHSGRSEKDKRMNRTAFVEATSLEMALFDSKLSLVQLLYSTIVEI